MKSYNRLLIRLLLCVLLTCSFALAQKTVHVRTYTRKDGTVVQAHNRAAPGTGNRSSSSSNGGRSSSASNTTVYTAPVYTPSTTTRARTVSPERDDNGRIKRSASAKYAFMLSHPCPFTGSTSKCPGYVIDHIKPLACGGADEPSNMQWQTVEAAKAKDKWERKGCR